jgi:hypothetical protein
MKHFISLTFFFLVSCAASEAFSAESLPLRLGCITVLQTFARPAIRFYRDPSKVHVRCYLSVPKLDIPNDIAWESQLTDLDAVIGKRDSFDIRNVTISLMHPPSESPVFERFKGYMDAVSERLLSLKLPDNLIYRELDSHAEVHAKTANNAGKADIQIDIYGIKASPCPACR